MPTLARAGRTATQHRREADKQRGSAYQRGYTRQWEKAAAQFKLEFPLCGMRPGNRRPVMSRCFDEGRSAEVFAVDHVVPHRGDMRKFWDRAGNWQSLCLACHNAKSRAGL